MFGGWGASDIGKQRNYNEDSYLIDDSQGLFAVADGVGGDGSGKIASAFVLNEFQRQMAVRTARHKTLDHESGLELLNMINSGLLAKQAVDHTSKPLASTFSAFIIQKHLQGLILHVGDSRIYGLDAANVLTALTGEHTLAAELKRQGLDSMDSSAADALINCMGHMRPEWHEVYPVQLHKYQTFLICSDGLSKMVDHQQLEQIVVNSWQQPDICVKTLINAALQAGGIDNITAIIIYRK
ncbi:MAG: protein phosphatase 2C domain-containing protein [Candidatus Marinimicrobia bacterium]|nr:protein phosphatase 2C domain-containing protein [Candidatus Neomarinimicrobiota bacterium]